MPSGFFIFPVYGSATRCDACNETLLGEADHGYVCARVVMQARVRAGGEAGTPVALLLLWSVICYLLYKGVQRKNKQQQSSWT